MLIYFSEIIKDYPNHTKEFGMIFNDSFTLKTNSILGTLRETTRNEYDLILTNPPYVTSGSSNLKEEINKDEELKKYYKVNGIGVEGLFMEWIIRALKPNGKAFVVVPDGIFNRQNDKNLREFIKEECFIDGIISLPLNTFFTTNKKTYILCLTKKNLNKDIQKDPVFSYLVSEIGESRDINRFEIEQNDLDEAVTLFNFFKGSKKSFKKFNQDPRCKVFDIDKFEADAHWSVDGWWSKEEKIELGIEEKDKSIKFEEFPYLLEDIASNIMSFKNEILELSEKKNSKIEYKNFIISDVFNINRGEVISKKHINQHQGQYPVFSSSGKNNGILGYIDSFNFDYEGVTWTIDGYAGKTFYRNEKFSMTNLCGLLTVKDTFKDGEINLEYISYILEPILRKIAKGRKGEDGQSEFTKVYPSMIKDVLIPLPIKSNRIDLEMQNQIVEKIKFIEQLKTKAKEDKNHIQNINVEIKSNYQVKKEIKISEVFYTKKGLSKYTKKYGQSNIGTHPVYSGSNISPIMYINSYDYNGEYLSWAVDGFAGYMKVLKGKFSATGHRGILIPKVDAIDIDLDYMKFIIEPILRKLAKGRRGDKGSNEYTNVSPTVVKKTMITIPTLPNGNLDLKKQQEIAQKYLKIEEIKNSITEELEKIEKILVEY